MVQKGGGMLLGRAGTGKSYVCKKSMKHYEDNVIVGYLNDDEKEIVEKKIICSDEVGGVSVKAFPNEPHKVYYPEKTYENRRYYWRYENPEWNDIPFNDSDDWLDIITEMVQKGGGMLLGRAGTGKSYLQ